MVSGSSTQEHSLISSNAIAATPTYAINASQGVVEEKAGTYPNELTFTITRTGDLSGTCAIEIYFRSRYNSEPGTAVAGYDFSLDTSSKVFTPGVASISFRVQILNDAFEEPDDTLVIGIKNPTVPGIITKETASAIIVDDDENSTIGGLGDDTLQGGAGPDTMDGGIGSDLMRGAGGDDLYYVDSTGDIVDEGAENSSGVDTVLSDVSFSLENSDQVLGDVENLTLTSAGDLSGIGTALNNRLIGYDGYNNFLEGNGGNDTLSGGVGMDSLAGGSGNDVYNVDNAGDTVDEGAPGSSGIDTVQSTISLSLAASPRMLGAVEHLTLLGSGHINATGNGLNNVLTGNSGNNLLQGGVGNDTLNGGAGVDRLAGGAGMDILNGGTGADTYLFTSTSDSGSPALRDRILEFTSTINSIPGDKINVLAIDADAGAVGDQAFVLDRDGSFSVGEIRQTASGTNVIIDFNVDFDAAPEMSLLLVNHGLLGAGDFVL